MPGIGRGAMRFEHDGMSLWYGTPDAPAPGATVAPDSEVAVTIGVKPADASNLIGLRYRVNDGPEQHVAVRWLRNDRSGGAQYFEARLGSFRAGDLVTYIATCVC